MPGSSRCRLSSSEAGGHLDRASTAARPRRGRRRSMEMGRPVEPGSPDLTGASLAISAASVDGGDPAVSGGSSGGDECALRRPRWRLSTAPTNCGGRRGRSRRTRVRRRWHGRCRTIDGARRRVRAAATRQHREHERNTGVRMHGAPGSHSEARRVHPRILPGMEGRRKDGDRWHPTSQSRSAQPETV